LLPQVCALVDGDDTNQRLYDLILCTPYNLLVEREETMQKASQEQWQAYISQEVFASTHE
jgi:hypothetical protein